MGLFLSKENGRKSYAETLMREIEKIRLKELAGFVESETFQQLEIVPVTPGRVKSYLNNPAAKPDDVVLYLVFKNKKLVAFRSLFAGVVFNGKEQIRFAWCSGNWVHPDFRRKGFAQLLLNFYFSNSDTIRKFYLWVNEINEPAIRLYKNNGYYFDGKINRQLRYS